MALLMNLHPPESLNQDVTLFSSEEKCPHIQPVFDYFHIVKNFNDKVVSEVRKDEQRRLYEAGEVEAARALKKTKYILTSSRATLQKKDADATNERVIHRGSSLFKTENYIRKTGTTLIRVSTVMGTL
ncbi:MAG: transposase [Schwartzia sp.]|nr:transposase [Schwartzia sp. (in: firmicutes)]